jgi:glycosyltransferase involved in cell wall biosynthesis
MKLAIIGSRGFLTEYGGFETFVKKLALGIKDNGYNITVYGLKRYRNAERDIDFPEIRRKWVPSLKIKFLEKISASFLSIIRVTLSKNSIVFVLGVSPGLFLLLPRLMGKKIILNVDGIEWKRAKWPKLISFFLHLSEASAVTFCHKVIADSRNVAHYINNRYRKIPIYIPYGAEINHDNTNNDHDILKKYNLKPLNYFVQVCRLEPENNSHIIVREFSNYTGDKNLVIIGDTPHSIKYKKHVKESADGRIKFLGAVYGDECMAILRHAYCYVHGHEAGGTNPALLEAMGSAKCPVVLNVPYNLEVIKGCGVSFSKQEGDLTGKLEMLDRNKTLTNQLGKKAFHRVRTHYTWNKVISDYDAVFRSLIK